MSMKMTMAEFVGLEPCPFCGGEAQTLRIGSWWSAACRTPFCCDVGKFDTEAEAIKAWNTRAERTCKQVRLFNLIQRECDGERYEWHGEELPHYCPMCGARVVER